MSNFLDRQYQSQLKDLELEEDKEILKDMTDVVQFGPVESGDSDTGIYSCFSEDKLTFGVGGAESMKIDASGSVSVGSSYTKWQDMYTGGTINGSLTGSSIAGITYTPSTTTILPYTGSTSSGTISISGTTTMNNTTKQRYAIFMLPKPDVVPNKVYVSGRLVTVGILGSDVQAAFAGDKLVFAPGEIDIIKYNERLTVALDYGDWLHHYNIELDALGQVAFKEDSNIVIVKMVSKVAQR